MPIMSLTCQTHLLELAMLEGMTPKDHVTLLNAFDILREKKLDFHATLVGTGLDNDNQRLLKSTREKNLASHVSLLGRRDEIPDYMNLIDLFVLSSFFWRSISECIE